MKKFIYLLFGCVAGMAAQAQYYSFSASTQAYMELTNADLTDTVLHNFISFLPDHPYALFGKTGFDSYSVGVETGYFVASSTGFGVAMDPMMGTAFRKITGQSSVKVKELVTQDDTVLIVQWKNMGLEGHPDTEYLNFQLKVHLASEQVEFHYGPSNYVRTSNDSVFASPQFTGPEVLVVLLLPDFSDYYEFNSISGTSSSPIYSGNYKRMNEIPAPNRVFTMNKRNTMGSLELELNMQPVTLYPNPSVDGSFRIWSAEGVESVSIYSVTGEKLSTQKGDQVILPTGSQLFYIEITLINGGRIMKKITGPAIQQ